MDMDMDIAQPPCCPEGSWGASLDASHSSKSAEGADGDLLTIGPGNGLELYVAKPGKGKADAKKAIMVFTDVYGFQNRLFAICDKLARDLNSVVVALDCLRGETKEGHSADLLGWLRRHPYDLGGKEPNGDIHPVGRDIERCFEFLSERHGVSREAVGAIGFCWGVWAMTKAISAGVGFRCGVGFHPSVKLEEVLFGMDQAAMARGAAERAPLLFCVAGNDHDNLKPPGGEIARMIEGSGSGRGAQGPRRQSPGCVVFPDMAHGWVSRGDMVVPNVRGDAERALTMASDFFADWL